MTRRVISRALVGLAGVATLLCAQAPTQKQPQPKSQKEAEAVMAIFNAADPASRIKAAEELLTKFADTEFKVVALQVAAASAQEMNDFEKMMIYGDRTLEADPNNYAVMLMIATGLAQRTREFDLDKEEKLGRSEKLAKQAMEILKTAPKPRPDITDEQWEGAKKDFTSQGWEALALGALARKKYDDAINQFKTAIDTASTSDPATQLRLAATYNLAGKHDQAIAVIDQVTADPQLNPQIRQFAQAEKLKAMKAKGGGAPEAKQP